MLSDRREDFCPERQLHLHQECVTHDAAWLLLYVSLIKEQEEENVMVKVHREDAPRSRQDRCFTAVLMEGVLET